MLKIGRLKYEPQHKKQNDLCGLRRLRSDFATHKTHSEDSGLTDRCFRCAQVFSFVLSRFGSYVSDWNALSNLVEKGMEGGGGGVWIREENI